MFATILALPFLCSAQDALLPTSDSITPTPPESREVAAELSLLLDALATECAYRIVETNEYYDFVQSTPERAAGEIRSVGFELDSGSFSVGDELLSRWLALEEGADPKGPGNFIGPRIRDLYVVTSPEAVFEAYFNEENERDVVAIWTPELRIDYNPGRRQIGFQNAPGFCRLLGYETLFSPSRIGVDWEMPVERTRNGDVDLYRFRREELRVAVEVVGGLPQRAMMVDRDMSVILSEFEYGPVGEDGVLLALTGTRKFELYRSPSAVQVTVMRTKLSRYDLDRSPSPIDVHVHDNLFYTPPDSANGDFKGRVDSHPLPQPLRRFLVVRNAPLAAWSKQ